MADAIGVCSFEKSRSEDTKSTVARTSKAASWGRADRLRRLRLVRKSPNALVVQQIRKLSAYSHWGDGKSEELGWDGQDVFAARASWCANGGPRANYERCEI